MKFVNKLKVNFSSSFRKFDYFDEIVEDESLICKFCHEEFPENTLSHRNRLRKLKKHLLNKHQDELPPSVAELLTYQLDHDAELNRENKRKHREEKVDKRFKGGELFDKYEHFDLSIEDETNSEMICKYCKERFKNKELTPMNEKQRLKRHLFLEHKEKLSTALAEFLTSRQEKERQRKKEYHKINFDKIKLKKAAYDAKHKARFRKERMEKERVVDPETGKVVNLRTIKYNLNRQFFKCPYEGCSQDAVSEYGLQCHIRSKHTGEKPFICNECGKAFAVNSQLTRHMNSHSDEANFQCKFCDKRYKNPNAVVKHQKEGRGCEGLKRMQAMGCSIPETLGKSRFYIKLNS